MVLIDFIQQITGETIAMRGDTYVYLVSKQEVSQGIVDEAQVLLAEAEKKALQVEYTNALETYMDSKAQERGYDTRYTASLRVNSTVEKFRLEGQAYIDWMDNCYALGYQIMDEVQAGTRPLPSVEEFLAELPELVW